MAFGQVSTMSLRTLHLSNNFVKKSALMLVLLTSINAASSHAALFDDKEARKKILEVESANQATDNAQQASLDALKKSMAALEKRVAAIEAIVQGGGLADMQNQIEALKQEVANLKGELEVAQHNVDATQQRQKDLYTDTDTRLRKIESGATAPAAATPAAGTDTTTAPNSTSPNSATPAAPNSLDERDAKAFNDANSLSQQARHKEAFAAFDSFLKDYPNSKHAADALYGMGYSQFALKNYKSSIATQQKVIDLHADSPKVPDAKYSIANSQIQLGQVAAAKKTLRDLIAKHPTADITPAAQKRLKVLETFR
jgi:tol-pal system protein YbgF